MTTIKRFLTLFLISTLTAFTMHVWGVSQSFAFATIGSTGWSNSYADHTVTIGTDATVYMNASKQTSNITTVPVTKGQPVSLVLSDNTKSISSVTFTCSQWTTKAQTITLKYSTNGGSSYSTLSPSVTSTNFSISSSSLPTGTNAVQITFSSQSNQVGLNSVEFSYASSGGGSPTLSSISVSTAPTKTSYTAGEYFDPTGLIITRNYDNSTSDTYTYAGHTGDFTFSPSTSTALTTSNTEVTITYGGKTTTQAITVNSGGGGGGGSCSVFGETWAGCDGTGGNSGGWSGSIASSSSVVSDNTGWTYSTGYKGNECIRTSKGGTATTPSITVTSGVTYTLSYKAADWGTDGCSFAITATGANVTTGSSSGALSQGSWGNYSATLTATASSMQITFTASTGARGWLDEICIDVAGPTYTITATVDDPAHGSVSVSGNTITVTPTAGWVPNSATVSPANSATVSQSGNIFTVTPTSDCSITIGFRAANTYTVTLKDNGKTTTSTATEGVPFELPDEGDSNCDDATFLGWATGEYTDHLTGTTTEPTYDAPGTEKDITAATTFTAVYGIVTEGVSNEYSLISSAAELQTGDYLVVADYSSSHYAMGNSISSSIMDEESVSISSNKITTTKTNIIWHITKTGENYTLYNAVADKYLAVSSSNILLQSGAHSFTAAFSGSACVFESLSTGYQLAYDFWFESAASQSRPIKLYKRGSGIGTWTSKPQCCQAPATALSIESDVTTMVASGTAHLTLSGGNGKNITWSTTGGTLSNQSNSGATLTLSDPGVYTVTATQADDETDPDNVVCGATVTVNITVKAQYTIIFNTKDNGVVSEYSRLTVTEGNTYTMPDISEDYDCGTSGASFAGWVDALDDTAVEAVKGSTQTATGNKTWYAAWSTSGGVQDVYLYTKVNNKTELTDGCIVLIGNTAGTYALGGQNTNNRAAVEVSQNPDNENQIYFTGTDVKELTVGISDSYYTFYDSEENGYLYAASSSSNYLRTQTDLDANGKFAITITDGVAAMTAQGTNTRNQLKYNSGSDLFSCYSSGQKDPAIYKKSSTKIPVSTAGTTITTNNTSCDKGATIIAETGKWITSTKGQKVKLVLPVTARGFETATTLGITANSNSAHFSATLAETAVTGSPANLSTTLTVEFTPADEGIENTTIALTAGEVTKNIVVKGRSLPDEFAIIAKKTLWYALPANMNDGAGVYDGVNVVPDDASDPTLVPVAPSTIVYSLKAVAPDRYATAGNCVRLVGNGDKCLWANAANSSPNNTKIQNYAVLGNTNGSNYEWLLTTTDGVQYTINNPAHVDAAAGRKLANGGTGGIQFGLFNSEAIFYIVPIGCSSQPGEINVRPRRADVTFSWVSNASTMNIDLYTNEGRTEGHIAVTVSSSPQVITGLEETTDYWYTLTPGSDDACAIQGKFTTTGPTIDVVEWEENTAIIFVDKDESLTPTVVIDGEVEHGVGTGATATELFFSKYFEGAGDMKLVAIFNGTANDVSLADYSLYTLNCPTPDNDEGIATSSFSGSTTEYPISALGTIKAGQEIIFYSWPKNTTDQAEVYDCSTTFLNEMGSKSGVDEKARWIKCDGSKINGQTFPAMQFNGNDAICLKKNSNLIDIIGATGDPGKVKNCANRKNDIGWAINVKNIDYGRASDDDEFDELFAASSLSPSNDTERRAVLAGFNIDLDNEYIDLTTARCILFRDKRVTSGDSAVAMNTGAQFVTCTTHTESGTTYKSEWNGRLVCMNADDRTAAGVTTDGRATCNSYQDLGAFDYSLYYKDWNNINPGLELDNYTRDEEAKTYAIPIPELAKYSCLNLRFQLKDGSTVLTETPVQVPILVTDGKKYTTDAIFNTIVKTDGGDPVYDQSITRCQTCNVVILGDGILEKAAGTPSALETAHDVPQIGNLKIYPGGKLIVPTGTSYTVNSLAFRRQEDNLSSADIQGTLNIGTPQSVFLDVRIDPTNWHYISLPYDCNVSDIRFANEDEVSTPVLGTDYLLKWYNGKKRAETQAGGCWEMVASDAVLKKGLGYIIAIPGDGKVKREFRFPMANDVITDDLEDKTVTGLYGYGCDKSYTDVRANHRGWNLLGNPYLLPYSSSIENPVLNGEIVEDHSTDPWDGHYKFKDPVNDLRYIVEPVNNGWSEYKQVAIDDYPMNQFSCYFVQIGGTNPEAIQGVNFSQSRVTGRSSIVRRAAAEYEEEEDTHPVWCAVDLTNSNNETDETTMLISNDFTDGYDIMNDLVKMRGDYYQYAQITKRPVLASRNSEGEMAFNALPDASAAAGIPLNYFAAYQGDYTISFNDKYGREEIQSVELYDATTQQYYDLLTEPYSFTTAKGNNNNRFTLYVSVERKKTPQIATDLDNVSGSEHPRKVLINGHVYILRGGAVYDLTGKQLLNR